jgi:hypothetical protein
MKRRPWYRLHLFTFIVLLFVACGLLWLNLYASLPKEPDLPSRNAAGREFVQIIYGMDRLRWEHFHGWGWPLPFLRKYKTFPGGIGSEAEIIKYRVIWFNFIVDIVISIIILGAVAFVLEWPIRRRERQKQAKQEGGNNG